MIRRGSPTSCRPSTATRNNPSIAATLFLSERTVMAHMRSVFTKLGLVVEDGATHRRVLAVITYLSSQLVNVPTSHPRNH